MPKTGFHDSVMRRSCQPHVGPLVISECLFSQEVIKMEEDVVFSGNMEGQKVFHNCVDMHCRQHEHTMSVSCWVPEDKSRGHFTQFSIVTICSDSFRHGGV